MTKLDSRIDRFIAAAMAKRIIVCFNCALVFKTYITFEFSIFQSEAVEDVMETPAALSCIEMGYKRGLVHNLCFGAKIRKIGIPQLTPVLLYKCGVQGGIHYTDMFS